MPPSGPKGRSTVNSSVGRNPDPPTYTINYLLFDVNRKSRIQPWTLASKDFETTFHFQRDAVKAMLLNDCEFRAKASSIDFYKVSGAISPAVVCYVRS